MGMLQVRATTHSAEKYPAEEYETYNFVHQHYSLVFLAVPFVDLCVAYLIAQDDLTLSMAGFLKTASRYDALAFVFSDT